MTDERLIRCEECGIWFEPRSGNQRFCSSTCRYRWRDRRDYERDPEGERARCRDYYRRNREKKLAAVKAYQATKRAARESGA